MVSIPIGTSDNVRQGSLAVQIHRMYIGPWILHKWIPEKKILMNQKQIIGLIDTGYDITIIIEKDWLSLYSIIIIPCNIKGIINNPVNVIEQNF